MNHDFIPNISVKEGWGSGEFGSERVGEWENWCTRCLDMTDAACLSRRIWFSATHAISNLAGFVHGCPKNHGRNGHEIARRGDITEPPRRQGFEGQATV